MRTNHRLRARAIALRSNITDLLAHPPKRGSGERVSGGSDPRRLPVSETILEIARFYDDISDRLASGNLALSDLERTAILTDVEEAVVGDDGRVSYEVRERLCPIPTTERYMALILLARREVVEVVFPPGTSAETQRYVVRIEALSDLGDDSDKYVDAILRDIERRVEEWVRGDQPAETFSS